MRTTPIRLVLVACVLAGCWRGDAAPAEEPRPPAHQEQQLCAEFSFKILMHAVMVVNGSSAAVDFDTADAEAQHDAEQAGGRARTDMLGAATLFMLCASRYRSVPDADPLRETASYNAVVCYENAMYAYAMAGKLATVGKRELERAEREDARMAPELRRILGSLPTDCAVQR